MTITLTPETEAMLRERAARDGQETNALADALLAGVLADQADEEAAKQKAFNNALLASGLASRITPPRDPSKSARPTFRIEGEPLSETILRERR